MFEEEGSKWPNRQYHMYLCRISVNCAYIHHDQQPADDAALSPRGAIKTQSVQNGMRERALAFGSKLLEGFDTAFLSNFMCFLVS